MGEGCNDNSFESSRNDGVSQDSNLNLLSANSQRAAFQRAASGDGEVQLKPEIIEEPEGYSDEAVNRFFLPGGSGASHLGANPDVHTTPAPVVQPTQEVQTTPAPVVQSTPDVRTTPAPNPQSSVGVPGAAPIAGGKYAHPAATPTPNDTHPAAQPNTGIATPPSDGAAAGNHTPPENQAGPTGSSDGSGDWQNIKKHAADLAVPAKWPAWEDIIATGLLSRGGNWLATRKSPPPITEDGVPISRGSLPGNLFWMNAINYGYDAVKFGLGLKKAGISDFGSHWDEAFGHVNYATDLATTFMVNSNRSFGTKAVGVIGSYIVSDIAKDMLPKSWDKGLQPNWGQAVGIGIAMTLPLSRGWKNIAVVIGATAGQVVGNWYDNNTDTEHAHNVAEDAVNDDSKQQTSASMMTAIDKSKELANNPGGSSSLDQEWHAMDEKTRAEKNPPPADVRQLVIRLVADGEINLNRGSLIGDVGDDYVLGGKDLDLGGRALDMLYKAHADIAWLQSQGQDLKDVQERVNTDIARITGRHNISDIYEYLRTYNKPITLYHEVVEKVLQPQLSIAEAYEEKIAEKRLQPGDVYPFSGGRPQVAKLYRDQALIDLINDDAAGARKALDKAKQFDPSCPDNQELENVYQHATDHHAGSTPTGN